MSSHVHMIVARHGEQNLEAVIRDIKKYTSVKLIQAIRDNEQQSRRELFSGFFEREGKIIRITRTISSGNTYRPKSSGWCKSDRKFED
jgi:hypothetical protein